MPHIPEILQAIRFFWCKALVWTQKFLLSSFLGGVPSKYFNSINKMQRLSGRRRGKLNLAVIQIQLKRCHLEEMSLFYFTKFDRFAVWATVIILDDLLLLSDNVCKIFSLQTLSWSDVGLCVQIQEEDRDIFNLFGSFGHCTLASVPSMPTQR